MTSVVDEEVPRAPEGVGVKDLLALSGWLDDQNQPLLAGQVRDVAEERLHDFYAAITGVKIDPVTGDRIPRTARSDPGFVWGCDLCRERYGLPTSTPEL